MTKREDGLIEFEEWLINPSGPAVVTKLDDTRTRRRDWCNVAASILSRWINSGRPS